MTVVFPISLCFNEAHREFSDSWALFDRKYDIMKKQMSYRRIVKFAHINILTLLNFTENREENE